MVKYLGVNLFSFILLVFTGVFLMQTEFAPPATHAFFASDYHYTTNIDSFSEAGKERKMFFIGDQFNYGLPEHILAEALNATPPAKTAGHNTSLSQFFFHTTGTMHPWSEYPPFAQIAGMSINRDLLGKYLVELDGQISRSPQDAILEIKDGRAIQFQPDRAGIQVMMPELFNLIKRAYFSDAQINTHLSLPLHTTRPAIQLGGLSDRGINTLIARGESDFSGSTFARIHNIKTGAEKYNGLIIVSGDEFSFNKYLGPVDAKNGFLPELVIKAEGTIPEFGGGLCQVSTTAFRAAFFGGLPITQRKNHSYAVSYYEWINDETPPAVGLDATIYPGVIDLKFINNTPGDILVWTKMENSRLYFEFYGTLDRREVLVDGPHPYDRRASGAVKSIVERIVLMENGEIINEEFRSSYVSPNLFPRVYGYVSENPDSGDQSSEEQSLNESTKPHAPNGPPSETIQTNRE